MSEQHGLLQASAPITYTRKPAARAAALPAIPSPICAEGLDAYLKALRGVPVLGAEEELRLAQRLRSRQDHSAAQALVLGNLRFVVHIARGYRGYRLPLADLIQEGNIGLMKAVRRFDPAAGVRLISFAVHWIKSEIHEFILRNWQIIRIGTSKAQRKLFFNLRKYRSRLGWMSRAEAQTIARELSVPLDEVLQMEARLGAAEVPLGPVSEEPGARGVEDTLADERDDFVALEEAEWTARQNASMHSAPGGAGPALARHHRAPLADRGRRPAAPAEPGRRVRYLRRAGAADPGTGLARATHAHARRRCRRGSGAGACSARGRQIPLAQARAALRTPAGLRLSLRGCAAEATGGQSPE